MVSKMAWYGTGTHHSVLSRIEVFLFASLLNTGYVGIILPAACFKQKSLQPSNTSNSEYKRIILALYMTKKF
jgi:hypothetical protein